MLELLIIAVLALALLFLFGDIWWLHWLSGGMIQYRTGLIIVLISALIGLLASVITDLPYGVTYSFIVGGFAIAAADRAVRRKT